MKKGTLIYSLVFLLVIAVGCEKGDGVDGDLSFLNTAVSANIDKVIDISTDNSGIVKITPLGEGVSSSTINFGHGTGAGSTATVLAGGNASHVYPEGNHTVTIISKDLAGKETTNTYPITLTYKAPENVQATINNNANSISVKATALYAASYLVYFNDVANEVGTPLTKDGTVYHEYAAAGDYDVKVVAISGNDQYSGAAKKEAITAATIAPFSFKFPITFDEAGVNYFFGTFGGGQQFAKVANPDASGLNTTASVGKFTRGHESWSGTYSPMNYLIDLTTTKKIKVLVFNPDPALIGKKLNIELESAYKGAPGNGVAVLKVPVTKSGEWEELVFDFGTVAGLPAGSKFGQLVLRFNDSSDGAGGVIYVDNFRLTN
jgi:hypothetical protein